MGTVLGPWRAADSHCPGYSLLLQYGVGLELLRIRGWGLQSLEGSEPRGGCQSLGENSLRLPNRWR